MQKLDRRSGPRRSGGPASVLDGAPAAATAAAKDEERRHGDRRKRKPGVAALFGAILGVQQPHAEG